MHKQNFKKHTYMCNKYVIFFQKFYTSINWIIGFKKKHDKKLDFRIPNSRLVGFTTKIDAG